MRSKTDRKNAHKERIFTLKQNREDFDFIESHRAKVGFFNNAKNRIKYYPHL